MISIEDSFPTRSGRSLLAQDILWTQFNDVNFYVEDIDQQNFYLNVLKKLFPTLKINRIFPLGGKPNVIKEARKSRSKKKVFLLDLDFDEIVGTKVHNGNIFYLKKYSIENYLLEKEGIFELIKEENPKISDATIKSKFSFSNFQNDCFNLFHKLSCNFLLIKKYQLGLDYLNIEPHRDCDFSIPSCCIKNTVINPYFNQVETALNLKKPKMKYTSQIKQHSKYFNTIEKCLANAPGKYFINFLKITLKKIFQFSQTSIETFTYRLMKNCSFRELDYLKVSIDRFLT